MAPGWQAHIIGVTVRVGAYALLVVGGLILFSQLLVWFGGYLVSSAVGVFLAGTIANALAMRIFERTHLTEIGLIWTPASVRNLLLGLAGGAGAALVVLAGPLAVGAASFEAIPKGVFDWRTLLFVSVVLLFGAIGEEMMFRGYGFQALIGILGPVATVLAVGVLFGLAHLSNLNISKVGLVNTMLWGVLLGFAFLRSGDLWLPIGLHFGWNWILPLFGVNLSGFTMDVTGYVMSWKIGPLWSGGNYGPEGGLLTTGVLLLLSVFLWKAPIIRQVPFLLRPRAEE